MAPSSRTTSGPMVVFIVCLAALVLPLSFSGGAVATPATGRDLGGSATAMAWITNAFMLTFGSLLMTAGALADQFGRKRIFLGGVGLFVLFSAALNLAPSMLAVDLMRAGQGVGAAAALAAGSALMAQEFDRHARIRAFSMLGTTFGLGLAFGPVIAGVLVEHFGWRSVFMTSTIIGAIALVLGAMRLHETRDPNATGLDWPGALSFTTMLSLLTFAVIQAPESGWSSPLVLTLLGATLALLVAFVKIETSVARPMLDLSLFRYGRFVGVQLLPIATCFSYVVLLILLPLRFIGVEGHGESEGGLLMMALSAPMLVVPPLAAIATRRVSAGVITGIGLVIAAVGLVWLGTVPPGDAYAAIGPMLVIGVGAGAPWGLMDGLAVSVVPRERAGMASGIFNTSKVASEGVALALVSAALAGLNAASLVGLSDTTVDPAALPEIGHRLATGDTAYAMSHGIDHTVLLEAYGDGFRTLTQGLAGIALLSALATFTLLGGSSASDSATEQIPDEPIARPDSNGP